MNEEFNVFLWQVLLSDSTLLSNIAWSMRVQCLTKQYTNPNNASFTFKSFIQGTFTKNT